MSDTSTASDSSKSSMSSDKKLAIVGLLLVIVVAVVVVFATNSYRSTMSNAKTGTPIGSANVTDGIVALGTINKVDPVAKTMVLTLAMTPQGALDAGGGILSAPITLYYDGPDGTKQLDFKADKPLGSTDLTIPLEGSDVGSYPWDKYQTSVDLLFVATTPATPAAPAASTTGAADASTGAAGSASDSTAASGAAPSESAPSKSALPVDLTIQKNVPSYSVLEASGSQDNNTGVISANFTIKRAGTALFFSLMVTIIMWGLALGVTFIALSVILGRRKFELALVTMMAAILFAMPAALRSFQPGIPAPGVLSDFYGFIPCDVLVALSLIATVTVYLVRKPS